MIVWTTDTHQDHACPMRVQALSQAAWPVLAVLLSGAVLAWLMGRAS